jgi:hypothetical protein
MDRLGLLGPGIANPEYLEVLICHGHDIVFGTNVAWGNPDANGVYDVILDGYGKYAALEDEDDAGHRGAIRYTGPAAFGSGGSGGKSGSTISHSSSVTNPLPM